jgi:hypothetical protein
MTTEVLSLTYGFFPQQSAKNNSTPLLKKIAGVWFIKFIKKLTKMLSGKLVWNFFRNDTEYFSEKTSLFSNHKYSSN